MRSPAPAGIVALALLASAARADSFLDKPAPEPAVAKWVAGEPPPAWKALGGRCALLELFDPDDIVSLGLVSHTVEIAAKAAERKLVIVSVAVGTGAEEGKAGEFAKRFRMAWPVGVDRRGETYFAAGSPTLPRYFLIAPDGSVMWEGSPGVLDAPTLDGFLERARLWRPAEVARTMRPAAEAFTGGKYGTALKKAEEALVEFQKRSRAGLPVDGDEGKDAAVVRDAVKNLALLRLGVADRLAKDRWSLDAQEMLEAMVRSFAGTEWEGKAKEALAAIAADKRAVAEIEATKRLREILAAARPTTRKRIEKAIAEIDEFLLTKKELRAGERAVKEKGRLEKMLAAAKE